jgi:hypothetical protein
LELQILRFRGNRGTRKEFVVVADTGTVMNGYIVQKRIVVADDDILVYDAEGTDDVAIAELCLGVNHC